MAPINTTGKKYNNFNDREIHDTLQVMTFINWVYVTYLFPNTFENRIC